jgi:hypothetical protein
MIEWTRDALRGFPGSQYLLGLPGVPAVPDDDICIQCLKAARWDFPAMADVLRQMNFEHLHPDLSWAWFVAVLRKRLSIAAGENYEPPHR